MRQVRNLALVLALLTLPYALFAQVKNPLLENPKYGPDEATRKECIKQTSFYQEFYKQNNYRYAASGWAIVYKICPQSSKNIFIRGVRMLKAQIDTAKSPETKRMLVDSLLRVYDKRIEFYGEKNVVNTSKALDLFSYDQERYAEVEQILTGVLKEQGNSMDPSAMIALMQVTMRLYGEQKKSNEDLINLYSQLSGVFAAQVAAKPNDADLKAKSESLDGMFASAGVANCADMERIYDSKLPEGSTDGDLARGIYAQLSAMKCSDSPLYLRAAKIVFAASPSTGIGLDIARTCAARGQQAEAESYFKKVLGVETDNGRKAQVLVEYGGFVSSVLRDNPRARTLIREALTLNPKLGVAYMLLAQMYMGTRNCGVTAIDQASVYWIAADMYAKAKAVDPSLSSECDKQIAYLSQYFPLTEDIFFQDLSKGAQFTVPCWINETTTIRSRD